MAAYGSPYRWGASATFLGMDIRPSVDQQRGDCSVATDRGPHQGRHLSAIPRVHSHALVQQRPHAIDGALLCCDDQLLPERRDTRPAPVHFRQDNSSSWLSHHPRTPPGPGLCSAVAGGGPDRVGGVLLRLSYCANALVRRVRHIGARRGWGGLVHDETALVQSAISDF